MTPTTLQALVRHLTSLGYWAIVSFIGIVAAGMSQIERPATLWPMLVTLLAIIAGARIIGPEFASGSLQLILVKPVNRCSYLVSRVAGVVLAVWIGAFLGLAGEAIGRFVSGTVPWEPLLSAFLFASLDAILIVSLLAMFGSFTRGYTNVELYIGIQLVLMMVLAFARGKLPSWLAAAIAFVQNNLFPDAPAAFNVDWLLLVLSNAAIALVIACFAFSKREVPYGAD